MIIQLGNKIAKHQPVEFKDQNKRVSSYWIAIKNIYTAIIAPILDVEPQTVKVNLPLIAKTMNLLELLCKFFD